MLVQLLHTHAEQVNWSSNQGLFPDLTPIVRLGALLRITGNSVLFRDDTGQRNLMISTSMEMALWSKVPTGEPTPTSTRSWTSVSTKSRTHPSMCVFSVTIWLQPAEDANSSAALQCTVVVEVPSYSSWWAFTSPTSKKKRRLSINRLYLSHSSQQTIENIIR